MSQPVTATDLRRNLYRLLDQVLQSGEPQAVRLKKGRLLIVPEEPRRLDLDALPKRKGFHGTTDELVELSWADAWKPDV
jgi:hypothetical protein